MTGSLPADRARGRFRLPDPSDLSAGGFSAVVLALLLAAAWLGARGLEDHAFLREGLRAGELKAASTSPLPYRADLPATRALLAGAARPPGPVVVLRADGATDAGDEERLCALAHGASGASPVPLRWVALAEPIPSCLSGASVQAAAPGQESAVAAELGQARWLVLGADGRVRHSARDVPDAARVWSTVAVVLATASVNPHAPHDRP